MSSTRVCLLGLTADPPHVGHAKILQHLSGLFDQVVVLPVFRHMFKGKRDREGAVYDQRIAMCEKMVESINCGNIVVSHAEKAVFSAKANAAPAGQQENIRVGTAEILEYFQTLNSDNEYHFCMGGDVYRDLISGKWRRTEQIKNALCTTGGKSRLHVVDRIDEAEVAAEVAVTPLQELIAAEENKTGGFRATVISLRVPGVSSSKVRELLANGDDQAQSINTEVHEYIKKHNLYVA